MFLIFGNLFVKYKDPDFLGLTNEDPIISGVVSEVVEPLAAATPPTPSGGGGGGVDGCDEKALVVYNPTSTPLFKSPTSPDFSLIVSSDLIPGLKGKLIFMFYVRRLRKMLGIPTDLTVTCLEGF